MQDRHRLSNRRRPCFERLEERDLLATVTNDVDGNLVITGDSSSETVEIAGVVIGDAVVANAVFVNGIQHTTAGDISINLGSGSDTATLFAVQITGDLNYSNTDSDAADADLLELALESDIGGDVTYLGGSGADALFIDGSLTNGNLVFMGGAGDDEITTINARVSNDVFAMLGSGTDRVDWLIDSDNNALDIGGTATIMTGSGNDVVRFEGFGSNEAVNIAGGLNVIMGSQPDTLDLVFVEIGGSTIITSGAGADDIVITDSTLNDVVISTGSGDDEVTILRSEVGSLILLGGSGNDTFTTDIDPETLDFYFSNFEN